MNKLFTKEVKIALVAIAGIVLLFFGMNFLKGLALFGSSTTYKMSFKDAKGLTNNTAIYADGYKVGSVSGISYDFTHGGHITVTADLDPALRIPVGTTAMIESDLMGNQKVSLLLSDNTEQRINPGETIPGVEENGLMSAAADMLPTVQAMLPKLDSIVTSINTLLSDPAIASLLHNADAMSANLKQSTMQLNAMMAEMNKQLPDMMQHANATMSNTEQLTAKLNDVDISGTMAQVNRTLDNVEKLTAALNSNEGSLGKLMRDDQLYDNLTSVTANADSLMIDLKAHPKRYVHFSVFGKKDK